MSNLSAAKLAEVPGKQAAQKLVRLFTIQLRQGCGNRDCRTRTCYSYKLNSSSAPPRPLSDLSVTAIAFYLASSQDSVAELCPCILSKSLPYLLQQGNERDSEAFETLFPAPEPHPATNGSKKDPKSFTQALFDTQTIQQFTAEHIAAPPEAKNIGFLYHDKSHERDHMSKPLKLSELRTKLDSDRELTRQHLNDAFELLGERMVLLHCTGNHSPLKRAVILSVEVLTAWIKFHHEEYSAVDHPHNAPQHVDEVSQALEEEPAMNLVRRLVEILTTSDSDENWPMKGVFGAVKRYLCRTDATLAETVSSNHHLVHVAASFETDEASDKNIANGGCLGNDFIPSTWISPSPLLALFHSVARLLLYSWDGKSIVHPESLSGKCIRLLKTLRAESTTLAIDYPARFAGGVNSCWQLEVELRLDPYETASTYLTDSAGMVSLISCEWMFSRAAQANFFRALCFVRMMQCVEDARLIYKLIFDGFSWELTDRQLPPRAKSLSHGTLQAACSKYFTLSTRRKCLLSDTFDQIWRRQVRELLKPLRVNIRNAGEEGLDQGGVAQEFFRAAVGEALKPEYGCFIVDPRTRMAWFDPKSVEPVSKYEMLGLVCALAVHNGFNLSVNFPLVLYKKLLGEDSTTQWLNDLSDGWPELARGLLQSLTWEDGDVGDIFARTYVFSFESFDSVVHIDMQKPAMVPQSSDKTGRPSILASDIPSSQEIAENATLVTNQNRESYVRDYADWLVNKSVAPQFEAFAAGFHSLIPHRYLRHVHPETLRTLVEGQAAINVDELQAGTTYEGYTPQSRTIRAFWSIVRRYSQVQLRALLEFVTATDRVPVTGCRALEFMIQRNGDDTDRLPTATTCFGRLLLPDYATPKKLESKLKVALENASGFGLR